MTHETESGIYPERIHADNGSSVSSFVENNLNKPLPWLMILAFVVMFCTVQSYIAKEAAFDAQTSAKLAEEHLKYLQEYTEKLRFEMASHGLIPPDYPKE